MISRRRFVKSMGMGTIAPGFAGALGTPLLPPQSQMVPGHQ